MIKTELVRVIVYMVVVLIGTSIGLIFIVDRGDLAMALWIFIPIYEIGRYFSKDKILPNDYTRKF